MEKITRLSPEMDQWSVASGLVEGTPFIARFRTNLTKLINAKQHPHQITMYWDYETTSESLMPTDADMDLMREVEEKMSDVFEQGLEAVLVYVFTGQNQRESVWYAKDAEAMEGKLNEVLAPFGFLPIEFTSVEDENWNEYRQLLARMGQKV
jgi:hypothetical protein